MVVDKHIPDLDELLQMLISDVSRKTAWKRQLAAKLHNLSGLILATRLAVVMERRDEEIALSPESTFTACRQTILGVAGSRVYPITKASLRLAERLAESLVDLLTDIRKISAAQQR